MQCACAILSSVACPAQRNFSTLSDKRHDFEKKKYWTYIIRVWSSSTTSLWNILHSEMKWGRYKKCILMFMYSTLRSCPILMKLEFLYFLLLLLKLSFHSVAVVLTLVQTKQIRIKIHKRNNTKTEFKEYKAQKIHKYTDF